MENNHHHFLDVPKDITSLPPVHERTGTLKASNAKMVALHGLPKALFPDATQRFVGYISTWIDHKNVFV